MRGDMHLRRLTVLAALVVLFVPVKVPQTSGEESSLLRDRLVVQRLLDNMNEVGVKR